MPGYDAGFAERDITPTGPCLLAGSLDPRQRPAQGVESPLLVKAMVLRVGGTRLAFASLDLCILTRETMAPALRRTAAATGIPEDCIVWCCTHTHSGPVSEDERATPKAYGRLVDPVWLDRVRDAFADAVQAAAANLRPCRLSRFRGFEHSTVHNRRVRFKDGRHLNTWNRHAFDEQDVQAVGAAGPVDPEVGGLAVEDADGRVRGLLYSFALHANQQGGTRLGSDYPGVVCDRLRRELGEAVHVLYAPGACGDVNPVRPHTETGEILARVIRASLATRRPLPEPAALACRRRLLSVPARALDADQEERVRRSGWAPAAQEFFRQTYHDMQERQLREWTVPVQVWAVGDTAFVAVPGELFVEWGMTLKRESPFPWTYPIELSGDWAGYLVTRDAWAGGGYEGLTAWTAPISVDGVEAIVATALDMLNELWQARPADRPCQDPSGKAGGSPSHGR